MTSERVQRQIDRLLDEAEQAIAESDWARVRDRALNVLALDIANGDAQAYLQAAAVRLDGVSRQEDRKVAPDLPPPISQQPTFRQKAHSPIAHGGAESAYSSVLILNVAPLP